MALLNLTDDEKKLLVLALRQGVASAARSGAKAGLELVKSAYAKHVETLYTVIAKVEAMDGQSKGNVKS